ncbi:hypothetical protein OJ997_04975 [Solirubrobacter phytolaccae]|uniref:Carboxypeptidase regulatory-like domain-containing protein n=1 Tax=Solirubrobacter phytolaccae TaxID=1404360 RepID=A0A9X3N4S6_9ACTN|nr:hypothetical protein [Solirubrobacter phytolaccae]MDA0179639.1 hypothetical protein [Solirubrobacter phytolaccae]
MACIALVGALGGASSAHAGTYTVRAVSPGVPTSHGWIGDVQSLGSNFVSAWSTGGLVGQFSLPRTNFAPGEQMVWGFQSDRDNIVGWSFTETVSGIAGGDWNTLASSGHGPWLVADVPSFNHGAHNYGFNLPGARMVTMALMCGGPRSCLGSNAEIRLANVDVALSDPESPKASAVGPLVNGIAPLKGTTDLTVNATDENAGVYRAQVWVDNVARSSTILDANGGYCSPVSGTTHVFIVQRPCKVAAGGSVTLDTTKLSDGEHQISVVVEDAAGNASTVFGPAPRVIDNVPPPVNTERPSIIGTRSVGGSLSATSGVWTGSGLKFEYQWQRFEANTWRSIAGAVRPDYTVTAEDGGKSLRVLVRASNGDGTTEAEAPSVAIPEPKGTVLPEGTGTGVPVQEPAETPVTRTQNGAGPVATATLDAKFTDTRRPTTTMGWGAKRRVIGTLLGRDGAPIVGAKVDVAVTSQLMDATAAALGEVVTDVHGRFAYELVGGISRTVRFAYRPILEERTHTQRTEVTARVIPKVTLTADRRKLRNRQAVTLRGRVEGAPAGSGKVVELRAYDGGRWRTFATTRLRGERGTFFYRYRFTRTTWPTNYRFRAVVRAEAGWPFVTGQTNAVKVHVRP